MLRPAIDSRMQSIPQAAQRFLDGLCHFDIDEITSTLCQNACLSLSNGACVIGKPGIRTALVRAMGSIHSFGCVPAVVWKKRDVAIIEADVSCQRVDGARVEFPLTMILRFRDGLIMDIRLLTYEPAVSSNFPCQPVPPTGLHDRNRVDFDAHVAG